MPLDIETILVLRERLRELLAGAVYRRDRGVCYNLTYMHGRDACYVDGYDFVQAFAQNFEPARRWPDGRLLDYFLPHDVGYGLWSGPNLEQRRALCRHLLWKLDEVEAGRVDSGKVPALTA